MTPAFDEVMGICVSALLSATLVAAGGAGLVLAALLVGCSGTRSFRRHRRPAGRAAVGRVPVV